MIKWISVFCDGSDFSPSRLHFETHTRENIVNTTSYALIFMNKSTLNILNTKMYHANKRDFLQLRITVKRIKSKIIYDEYEDNNIVYGV